MGGASSKEPTYLPMLEIEEAQEWPPGQEDPLEEGIATRPSIFAWRILWTEEPGGLRSMGLPRVGHNWSDLQYTHS